MHASCLGRGPEMLAAGDHLQGRSGKQGGRTWPERGPGPGSALLAALDHIILQQYMHAKGLAGDRHNIKQCKLDPARHTLVSCGSGCRSFKWQEPVHLQVVVEVWANVPGAACTPQEINPLSTDGCFHFCIYLILHAGVAGSAPCEHHSPGVVLAEGRLCVMHRTALS